MVAVIEPAAVQDLLSRFWFTDDQGNVSALEDLFGEDIYFTVGAELAQEEPGHMARTEVAGRAAVMAWHEERLSREETADHAHLG